jgi:hypothetical protein
MPINPIHCLVPSLSAYQVSERDDNPVPVCLTVCTPTCVNGDRIFDNNDSDGENTPFCRGIGQDGMNGATYNKDQEQDADLWR